MTVKKRVHYRVIALRRAFHVDTQRVRKKTIQRLEEIFKIASNYARGKVSRVIDDDGKERPLTIPERQFWARIAAYTAMVISNVAKGIDERQIDLDLDKLDALIHENKAKSEAEATRKAERDAEQIKAASGQGSILSADPKA